MKRLLFALASLAGLFTLTTLTPGCAPEHKPKYTDTYSTGEIKALVDESFAPLIQVSLPPYYDTYPNAKLNLSVAPEDSALRLLALDSVQLVVATRQLNDRELDALTKQQAKPVYIKIAVDGLALLVNPANPDSIMMDTVMQAIFRGQLTDWNQVSKGNKSGPIELVFDNTHSANLSYLQRELNISNEDLQKTRISIAGDNPGVIQYVATHPGAMGVVGSSWVFDTTRSVITAAGAKVVALGHKPNAERIMTPDDFYQPYTAYLADKSYPLRRDIYLIYRGGRTGLAMGYAAYMASDKGQRIVLRHGLFPANTPVRLVETTAEPLK